MQIELLKPRKLRIDNKVREYKAGEVVDLRANTANNFIRLGLARKASVSIATLTTKRLPIVQGFEFIYDKQVYWDGKTSIKESRIERGLALLDKGWQVIAPLYDTLLASSAQFAAEHAITEQIIPDLRIPVYETGLIFLRQCDATQHLLHLWREEQQRGHSPLAFMRALYVAQPLILAVPSSWMNI